MAIAAPPPLFDVLPKDLFSPLASQNREHYWLLLGMLHARYFGPDADLPPAHGWDRRELVASIVLLLDNNDPWELEAGESAATPLAIRAATYLNRLITSGWLFEEKSGGITVCSMPTSVLRFMEALYAFVEFTPNAVGAKMRSIEGALRRAFDSPQPGDDLDEAASQAKALVSSLGTMGLRVREVMRALNAEVKTADALRQIFGEYITKVYMVDYSDFASGDHPLAHKASVLALAEELSMPDHIERLSRWYADNRKGGNVESARTHLDRALRKITALNRLQDFIEQLEADLRRMNRRMLALIDYRLQSPSHLQKRLQRAVDGVVQSDASTIPIPSGPGQLLSGDMLYKPRKRLPPIPRSSDSLQRMSPEAEARMRLGRLAREARQVQPRDVRVYLQRVMGSEHQVRASTLPIKSIKDFRVVQTLGSMAQAATTIRKSRKGATGVLGKLPSYAFSAAGAGERLNADLLDMPDFYITKVGKS